MNITVDVNIMIYVIKAEIKDEEQIAKCARMAYCDEINKYRENVVLKK